ncbi:MAG: zincin-like metallopeptidase domain-containing protein, partial [Gemmatimonadota bacterium]|nr:zincin-like metallopeptidase domain-containing protein [Gemmatimonadota bacterium]
MATKTTAAPKTGTRRDIYAEITDKIVAQLQTGTRPWARPWTGTDQAEQLTRPLRAAGLPYRGINVLALWITAECSGYRSPYWMTFKQALDFKGAVRKGEKGTLVVYANTFRKEETNAAGETAERHIPFLKGYTVFNAQQIDGLPAHFAAPTASPEAQADPTTDKARRIAHAEAYFRNVGATVEEAGNAAYYSPARDFIRMPPLASFPDPIDFYSTLGHEHIHWTKSSGRLERDFGAKKMGDTGYAKEELVAELGAAFLCADLGLSNTPRTDHAEYIATWIQHLKNDHRLIFQASAHAQRAVDYLHARQPVPIVPADAPADE